MYAQQKAWVQANREHVLNREREYYLANKEKLQAQERIYREANKERIKARKKHDSWVSPDWCFKRFSDVPLPTELIAAMRARRFIKRALKEIKNETHT